ncbi:PE family protein PE6 [Mycobacterium tuberculosis variant bovis]|nr:PE family protein PE6 [Mycobacterium tuberculosis variant bovis]
MEPPGSPSWMSSPPDQPLPNSPPLAPLAISGPQQRLGRRIGGGLGAGTRARTHVQVLCKLAMERRRLIVEGVMPPTVCGNQCRDGRRHLVFGRRQHAGLVALRREVADPRCWRLVSLWWPGPGGGAQWPGGVAAGRARTLRPGRAMSGAGKLDGARHARCKNPMDRTECRARPRRLPSRCLPSHPRYPQRLGLPGAGRVAMVVSKVCSIRCGGACLHRRRSLILMSGLNAMLRGPRGCRRRSSIGSARRLGPKTGPLRRSWWRWGSCSPIGGRVAGAARSG